MSRGDQLQRTSSKVNEMTRQQSAAQAVMRSLRTANSMHSQGAGRGIHASRSSPTWRPSESMFEQTEAANDARSDDVLATLLQQALSGAQGLSGTPNIRVVEHLQLAIHAHAEASPRAVAPKVPQYNSHGLASWQAALAQKLILDQLDTSVLTATLAAACSLSRGHFSRLFKTTFGLPPHKWQRERRLEMAKELLSDPRVALADIAIQCGFNDQAHFTRVFKMMTEQTPAAWRHIFGGAGEAP